jgi:hypothetical protein
MARTQAWDVNQVPVTDTADATDFPQAIRAGDHDPNGGLYVLLERDGASSLALATESSISTLATVSDTRPGTRFNNSNASVQGIGIDGVATIDSGVGDVGQVLRFWQNPAVLRVGPSVKRARFAG